jgi:hypothetical protein
MRPHSQTSSIHKAAYPGPCRACSLCARLVEVREALTQIRKTQALQDSERKGTEQEANLRWVAASQHWL